MNILKMTNEEIKNLVDKIYNANKDELIKMFTDVIEELESKEAKQHKSLSDYRYYKEPNEHENYKLINTSDKIETLPWHDFNFDIVQFEKGNAYSIDTPNELLEREIKKRQLWFNLEKYLKEKGCLASNEDWKEKKNKYCVYYDFMFEVIDIHEWTIQKTNTIYSTDKVVLYDYMKNLTAEDIKIMFDVE